MSNIIQVLEQMGSDADLQQQDAVAHLIEQSGLSDELKHALRTGDGQELECLQDGCPEIICSSIVLPEDEPSDVPAEDEPAPEQPESRLIANG